MSESTISFETEELEHYRIVDETQINLGVRIGPLPFS